MADIVKELMEYKISAGLRYTPAGLKVTFETDPLCRKAAKEIARLRKANAELSEVLRGISEMKTELTSNHDYSRGWNHALFRAREAAARVLEEGGSNG